MTTKAPHPDVRDLGLEQGQNGCLSPSDYLAMTPAEAVEDAMRRVCEAQLRVIERLVAENRELRAKLAVFK